MKVHIGSKNAVKVKTVEDVFRQYELFKDAVFKGIGVSSDVPEQPVGLEQTLTGAKNRAFHSLEGADMSVGIESGLITRPFEQRPSSNFTYVAIFDGERWGMGGTPVFDYPPAILDAVFEQGVDLSEAAKIVGFTDEKKIGEGQGIIGRLTDGRFPREAYLAHAVHMALIPFIKPELYK